MCGARANRRGVNDAQPFDAVRATALDQLREFWLLPVRCGHDQLARIAMRNPMRGAKFIRQRVSANAQPRFERSWSVVKPGVNYAAISRTRAHAELRHLLEKKHVFPLGGRGARNRASHHAAADDYNAGAVHIMIMLGHARNSAGTLK